MNIRIEIEDKSEKYKEVINIEDVNDKDNFSYADSDNNITSIKVLNDGIGLHFKGNDHETYGLIKPNGYFKIKTSEGELKFSLKVLEFNRNNDIISIVYCLNDSVKSIKINYLGV